MHRGFFFSSCVPQRCGCGTAPLTWGFRCRLNGSGWKTSTYSRFRTCTNRTFCSSVGACKLLKLELWLVTAELDGTNRHKFLQLYDLKKSNKIATENNKSSNHKSQMEFDGAGSIDQLWHAYLGLGGIKNRNMRHLFRIASQMGCLGGMSLWECTTDERTRLLCSCVMLWCFGVRWVIIRNKLIAEYHTSNFPRFASLLFLPDPLHIGVIS